MEEGKCPISGMEAEILAHQQKDAKIITATYGRYLISGTEYANLKNGSKKYVGREHLFIAAVYRSNTECLVYVDDSNFDDIIIDIKEPKGFEKVYALLAFIYENIDDASGLFEIVPDKQFAAIVSKSPREYSWVIKQAHELGYLNFKGDKSGGVATLTISGLEKAEEELTKRGPLGQAFMAMSFNDDLDAAWDVGFSKSLDMNGWRPYFIKRHDHNKQIDDEMVAQIRASGLLVADLTYQSQNVYYEAGLARGLEIPVIFTCRADYFADIHFDVQQFRVIKWTTPDDLGKQLNNMIKANPELQPSLK